MTFADLKAGLLPPMTSWLRLEGELRPVPDDVQPASGDVAYVYTLKRPDQRSARGVASSRMHRSSTGHVQVTGQVSGAGAVPGTVSTITADVPTEPTRHDPLAAVRPAGGRWRSPSSSACEPGYPVVRGDAPPPYRMGPLRPDESLAARWSGRIGSEIGPARGDESVHLSRVTTTSIVCRGDRRRCGEPHGSVGDPASVAKEASAGLPDQTAASRRSRSTPPTADLLLTFDDVRRPRQARGHARSNTGIASRCPGRA